MIQALILRELINEMTPELKEEDAVVKPTLKTNINSISYSLSNEKNRVVYTAPALGLTRQDITMSIKNRHLRVKSKDVKLTYNFQNAIDHNLYVGEKINREKIEASLENGILTIVMPLKESEKEFTITF